MNLKSLFSLFNATPQRAVNARRQRKRFIHIFFCEKWGRGKRTKRNPVQGKGWQGSKHRVFGPIKHNNTARTIDKPIH